MSATVTTVETELRIILQAIQKPQVLLRVIKALRDETQRRRSVRVLPSFNHHRELLPALIPVRSS
jgi:hypothetical protein